MTQTKKAQRTAAALAADLAFYATGGVPSDTELALRPKIEGWHVVISCALGVNALAIRGKVHRYQQLPDGNDFTSHAVLWFDRHHRFVRTASSVFELGRQVGESETEQDIPSTEPTE